MRDKNALRNLKFSSGVISSDNISKLGCKIVAGGANNVLLDPVEDGIQLKNKGIVYAPDFVINAGGLIRLAGLHCGFTPEDINTRVAGIEQAVAEVLRMGDSAPSTHEAAVAYAKLRLDAGKPLTAGAGSA